MTCVGIGFLVSFDEIGATITVVENLFPLLFCNTKTGLIPPCSLPITGERSAFYESFFKL